jgi:hypothetical protein
MLQDADHVMGGYLPGMHGGDHAQDVRPVPADLVKVDAAAGGLVQGAIVGADVNTPQLRVGQVRQHRAVVEAEQGNDAEHDVGVGTLIGDQDLRTWPAVGVVDEVHHMQGVLGRTGDHLASQAHRLVGDHVQPGNAAFASEVFRVGPGVGGADRDDETHSVHCGDHPAAPRLREADRGLGLDEHSVGGGVVLRPQVVLVDVSQPIAGQRVGIGEHRAEPDVERVGREQGRDRDVHVLEPSGATGHRGERRRERRVLSHHLQDHLRQVHPGQHPCGARAQVDQARRLVQGVVFA